MDDGRLLLDPTWESRTYTSVVSATDIPSGCDLWKRRANSPRPRLSLDTDRRQMTGVLDAGTLRGTSDDQKGRSARTARRTSSRRPSFAGTAGATFLSATRARTRGPAPKRHQGCLPAVPFTHCAGKALLPFSHALSPAAESASSSGTICGFSHCGWSMRCSPRIAGDVLRALSSQCLRGRNGEQGAARFGRCRLWGAPCCRPAKCRRQRKPRSSSASRSCPTRSRG